MATKLDDVGMTLATTRIWAVVERKLGPGRSAMYRGEQVELTTIAFREGNFEPVLIYNRQGHLFAQTVSEFLPFAEMVPPPKVNAGSLQCNCDECVRIRRGMN